MKNIGVIVTVMMFCCSFLGCGPKKPDGMPDVVPLKVKIVDGDKPIEGVHIVFNSDLSPVVAGDTDSSGVAVMTTTLQKYVAKGVPVGKFNVICMKDPLVEHWKTPQEQAEMSPGEAAAYHKEYQEKCAALPREIPKSWGDSSHPVLTAEVDASTGEIVFDVEGRANE